MFDAADQEFMARALRLAEHGLYSTSPNPRVGCVIVHDGVVVGEGWHERAGEPHAEIHALAAAGAAARGATAYVTLEPCSHFGRTPPCAEALIAAGIGRVVAAMQDPNPLVAGRGIALLREAGLAVECGLHEIEARELNIGFVSRMTRGRPWVRIKIASSLDGKTALHNGQSQWITGAEARQDGHRWRARACAILTGYGTVRDDDPQLNVRGVETPRQPLKVVVDSRLELSPGARLLDDGRVLLATAREDEARAAPLRARGVEIVCLPHPSGKVDLSALMRLLAERQINEVHVEGGRRLNGALLGEGLVDEILHYQAPCILGDAGLGMFDLPPLERLDGRYAFVLHEVRRVGDDLCLTARAKSGDRHGNSARNQAGI